MSDLGDLLVLLNEADRRWRTVECELSVAMDQAGMREFATRRWTASTPERVPVEPRLVDRRLVTVRYRLRASSDPWRTRLDRLEYTGDAPEGIPAELIIDDGEAVWEQTGERISRQRMRRSHARAANTGISLLQPRNLWTAHQLAVTGDGECEGRPVRLLSATPLRPSLPPAMVLTERLGLTGDLTVDAELGLVLSAQWRGDDAVLETDLIESLRVDQPLDDALFRFDPPPGTNVSEGFKIPTRYVPAAAIGIATAVVGDRVARLFRRGPA